MAGEAPSVVAQAEEIAANSSAAPVALTEIPHPETHTSSSAAINKAQAESNRAAANAAARPDASPTTDTPSTTAEAPVNKNAPRENEFVEGGNKDRSITLGPELQKQLADNLGNRLLETNKLKDNGKKLSNAEMALLAAGQTAVDRIQSGQFTSADVQLAYFVTLDEYVQKAGASGHYSTESFTPGKKAGRLLGRGQKPAEQTVDLKQGQQKFTSDYLQQINFEGSTEQARARFKELSEMRSKLEQAIFPDGKEGEGWEAFFTSGDPTRIANDTDSRNSMRHEVVTHLKDVLAQKHGGKDFATLWSENATAAMEALYEANQEALVSFNREAALAILKGEKPTINTDDIEARAKTLEEKPTEAEIEKAKKEYDTARAAYDAARETHKTARSPIEEAELDVKAKDRELKDAEARVTRETTRNNAEITLLQDRLKIVDDERKKLPATVAIPQKGGGTAQAANPELSKTREIATELVARIEAARKRINDTEDARNQAQRALTLANEKLTEVTTDPDIKLKIDDAKDDEDFAKGKFEAAATKWKNTRGKEDEEKNTKENASRATGLRTWSTAWTEQSKIMDIRYGQKHGSEYTRDVLASTALTPSGELQGAEKIREHLFRPIMGAKFNADLARKMLSDEAIAKAIVWTYGVDTMDRGAGGDTLQELFGQLATQKEALAKKPNNKALQNSVRTLEGQALQQLLPRLNGSEFAAGKLMQFIIEQGALSAQKGEAYLTIEDRFTTPSPELTRQTENIMQERMGSAEINVGTKLFSWEGIVDNLDVGYLTAQQPLTVRVLQQLSRGGDGVGIDVRVDQHFFESLPDTYDSATMPGSFRDFYDRDGKLHTDPKLLDKIFGVTDKRQTYDWIRVGEVMAADADDALDRVDDRAADLSMRVASRTVDAALQLPTQDRKTLLTGISAKIDIDGVTINGLPRNFEVNFSDDGNFYITDKDTGERAELTQFYKQREEEYKQNVGSSTLTDTDREWLQGDLLVIQNEIGREIIRSQQRR